MRRVMGWQVESALDEYTNYARPKSREADVKYINGFEVASLDSLLSKPQYENFSKGGLLARTSKRTKMAIVTTLILLIWAISVMDLRF